MTSQRHLDAPTRWLHRRTHSRIDSFATSTVTFLFAKTFLKCSSWKRSSKLKSIQSTFVLCGRTCIASQNRWREENFSSQSLLIVSRSFMYGKNCPSLSNFAFLCSGSLPFFCPNEKLSVEVEIVSIPDKKWFAEHNVLTWPSNFALPPHIYNITPVSSTLGGS